MFYNNLPYAMFPIDLSMFCPQPLVVDMPFLGLTTMHTVAICIKANLKIHMHGRAAAKLEFQPN